MVYQEFIKKTRAHWGKARLFDQPALERSFAIFCANILRFQRNTPLADLPELYRSLLVRIALTGYDQQLRDPESSLDLSGLDFLKRAELRSRPGIITTFHTGSYRLLGRLLGRHRVPLSLLVSEAVYRGQREQFYADFYADDPDRRTPFEVINAERRSALNRMSSSLDSGRNLLIYLDGNVGQQKTIKATSSIQVSFLDSQLWVRAGAAGLSYYKNVPIYSIVSTRPDWNQVRITNPVVLQPETGENKIPYVKRVMQKVYAGLSDILEKSPSEWEGWLYLLPVDQNTETGRVSLEAQASDSRLFPFRLNGSFYAIDSPNLRTYAIEQPQYQDLRRSLKQLWNL